MKKIHYCLSFLIILCITTCSLSALVFADEHFASGHQVWDGTPPYIDVLPASLSVSPVYPEMVSAGYPRGGSIASDSAFCYFIEDQTGGNQGNVNYYTLSFKIGSSPDVSVINSYNTTGYYYYNFNGTQYQVFYSRCYINTMVGYNININGETKKTSYEVTSSGTYVDHQINSLSDYQAIANYFLFGVGDIDYIPPEPEHEEIEDGDLDIHGLLASADDLQYVGDSNASSNGWDQFFQGLISLLPDPISNFANGDNTFKKDLGYVKTTVPGINMIWDSPAVSTIVDYNDPNNISYTVWADGHSSAQVELRGYTYNDSCNFSKLQLRTGPLYHNPSTTSYYNTNSDFDVVLNYFLSNANFGNGVNDSTYNKTVFNTTFSRIYIQASRTDENGDIHKGAVSYVDFSTGSPVVHEGVTQSIDDIESSDSEDGTTQTVTQDYTVSGDTIIYGDTITNNNYTYNYPSGGLDVGDGDLLSTLLELFKALLDLIKDLFISRLVPYISLGFTGGVM